MKTNVWDKLSGKYDNLWVQKYSLTPSRGEVIRRLNGKGGQFSLLDVGCATGQLLGEIKVKYSQARLFGIDKSPNMIELAKQRNGDIELICSFAEGFNINMKFDFLTCCHSFPYYSDKSKVLGHLAGLLEDDGRAIFIQAGINNFYDRFVMAIVEKTAEKAEYLSRKDFCDLAEKYFIIEECFIIREKYFMPSICGFVLRKRL